MYAAIGVAGALSIVAITLVKKRGSRALSRSWYAQYFFSMISGFVVAVFAARVFDEGVGSAAWFAPAVYVAIVLGSATADVLRDRGQRLSRTVE